MTDALSRSAVLPALVNHNDGYLMYCDWHDSKAECESAIRGIPALDVAPVVRCKDCRYANSKYSDNFILCDIWGEDIPRDGYCYCGKRMDGEEE